MRFIAVVIASTMLWASAATAQSHGGEPEFFSDSGIRGPAYAVIVEQVESLSTTNPAWTSFIRYGTSVDGRPLTLIRIANPDFAGSEQRQAVVISGSTHGNEYLNIADRLPEYFVGERDSRGGLRSYFEQGGILYIVPVLNPDGYDTRRRANANGQDLNRDFDLAPRDITNFRQPETRSLASYLEEDLAASNANLLLTIDYHCCNGSLLYPWSYTMAPLPDQVLADHVDIAELMQNTIDPRYRHGSTGQVLGYTPVGTSKDYYFARYNALAFTYEGKYNVEDQRYEGHKNWWELIMTTLAQWQRTR